MGWRLRKSFRVAKGVNLNLSRQGVNPSVGIPGTGLFWTRTRSRVKSAPMGYTGNDRSSNAGCWILVVMLAGAMGFVVLASLSKQPQYRPTPPQEPSSSRESLDAHALSVDAPGETPHIPSKAKKRR